MQTYKSSMCDHFAIMRALHQMKSHGKLANWGRDYYCIWEQRPHQIWPYVLHMQQGGVYCAFTLIKHTHKICIGRIIISVHNKNQH